jgi:PIN domain nuclease of toxin-antitoxin system
MTELRAATAASVAVYVSPISAWEIGQLVSKGRLGLVATPRLWLARLLETPGVFLAPLSTDVLTDSSFLPGRPPRDPADRIMIATARDLGARLVTRDRALLAYAAQGHMAVVAC